MNGRILAVVILYVIAIKLNAQTVYLTENEKDIYWQPNTQIDFSDYQSPTNEDCIKYEEKYGMTMSANIGLRGIVDVPKKRGRYDKSYIAPVFCKNCSCILSEDSLGLKVDQLLFNIAEFCARNARKELFELQTEMNVDNINTMFFTTVKNKWDERMWSLFGTIIREVFVEKKDSAYISWRQTIDDVLQQTEDFATQPKDCYRFVINKPIEKGYKMAKFIMGDMQNKEEEKY